MKIGGKYGRKGTSEKWRKSEGGGGGGGSSIANVRETRGQNEGGMGYGMVWYGFLQHQ